MGLQCRPISRNLRLVCVKDRESDMVRNQERFVRIPGLCNKGGTAELISPFVQE